MFSAHVSRIVLANGKKMEVRVPAVSISFVTSDTTIAVGTTKFKRFAWEG